MSDASRRAAPDDIDADPIGPLVKLAARRPVPNPAQSARARAAARAEWIRVSRPRRRRVSRWRLVAAAIVIGTLGGATWIGTRQLPAAPSIDRVATLQASSRPVFVTSAEFGRREITEAGIRLSTGDRVETTGGSRATISVEGAVSVRLDQATSVVLDSLEQLTLSHGAVYVDAGSTARKHGFRVDTPFGRVHHVGTQFEVRLYGATLRVSVREGMVGVEREGERWTSRAGERMLFAAGRAPERLTIPTAGADWSWIDEEGQAFQLEGATVGAFLDWASRELGVRWEFEDPALRDRVDRVVLHGSVEGLTAEEALEAVLPTCGLTFSRVGKRLVVSAAR